MMRHIFLSLILCAAAACMAQNVTVKAVNEPAATVFRTIVEQTGLNFVYSSDLLRGLRVSVDVRDKSLEHTLSVIFKNTDIVYEIRGKNIIRGGGYVRPLPSASR